MKQYTISTRVSWDDTLRELGETFRKWDIYEWTVSPVRPRTRANAYYQSDEERTVTLIYTHGSGREVRLTMDKQTRAQDNLRVLYLATEALRMNEARGIGDVIADAYLQLAAPSHIDPWELLGIRPDADIEIVHAAYRTVAKTAHPDPEGGGGSDEAMKELNAAYQRILEERGVA